MVFMTVRKARVTCPLDCPDACSLIASIDEESNTLLKIEGDPRHPITQGFACVKTYRYPERNHHPLRPLYPLRRVGRKGEGRFERVSWETALDEIAERLKEIIEKYGPEAVLPYYYAGTMGLMQYEHPLAFFRAIGASELETTICATAGREAWVRSYGDRYGVDPEDVPQARFILLWGINSLHTHTHLTPFLKKARQNGARIVHIDPYENLTSRFADEHIKIRPGSDAALAYGMARAIVQAGLHDKDYIARMTTGFEAFMQVAEAWTPERVEAVTGVPAEVVKRLALEFAQAKASLIRTSYGLTRHPGGGSALRAVILLPAITGAWQYPGGGALLSTSGAFFLNRRYLGGAHLLAARPTPPRRINMTQIGSALTSLEPPIRALFVFNSNPAVVAPRSDLVQKGLQREDLFTVVLEQALTETTRYADYVLPATTFLEHPDLYTAYGHYYLSWNEAVMPPQGEARPNTWVFAELGRRLGLEEPTLYWDAETLARSLLDTDHPWLQGITLERLKAEGFVRLNIPRGFRPFTERAGTPSGKVQFDPPPQVILTEPTPEFPLILLTPPAKHFLNTTYGHIERLVQGEGGEPTLLVHPEDARAFGVVDGARVRVRSQHGAVVRRVRVSEAPIRGTVVLEGTWWEKPAPDGKGINWLTGEHLTDMGAGSTFHSNPVRLEGLD
ncbi:molybdopterin oxidoreductase [Meiothermus taiwanensis WR-220]|jgi:anaerobic selenocysteine-containing dehydrogenase|uniref:Assimilatory nitrate reductase catalytic subunit n=3 Tax=Meiothermus taiwanensis TaxID=172827 RepID=A0A399DXX1_9DEIN|nr:molybdopterin oxidoreductase [Meiothermus taiwanensis WR-220]RIH75061.1 Assimilatory nitrate reductase catalytic subunit [Meiothermus taiwanensis]